jgi:hypothetical protein
MVSRINTRKYIVKRKIKTSLQKGGSSKYASSRHSKSMSISKATKEVKQSQLLELITSSNKSSIIINYKNIKLECILGGNEIILGSNKADNNKIGKCITIKYFPKMHFSRLESLFYEIPKDKCVGKDKTINNTGFIDNVSIDGIKPADYNKLFNETIMELIDIINIETGMKYCTLRDGSHIQDKKCGTIAMNFLKHLERGYGFYNEFGYMYKQTITESNKVLNDVIATLRNKSLEKVLQDLLPYVIPIQENISKIVDDMKSVLMRDVVLEIMKYCKSTEDKPSSGLFTTYDKDSIIEFKDFITKVVEKYLNLPEYRYSLTQYKLYQQNPNGTILKSVLEYKTDDEKREFVMKPIKKVNIDILELESGKYELIIID